MKTSEIWKPLSEGKKVRSKYWQPDEYLWIRHHEEAKILVDNNKMMIILSTADLISQDDDWEIYDTSIKIKENDCGEKGCTTPGGGAPFINRFELIFNECLEILEKKNNDYSSDKDPMRNFTEIEKFLNITAEQGIFVRIMDKISRLGNALSNKEMKVSDESVEDTLKDLINYSAILLALRRKRNEIPGNI
jgi:hypothetical protein